ncbi:MAG TPA: hypothetical protein PLP39_08890 [Flavobacterium lutivivi]|nr:hypothetical protein [Flavobacterium lutivivi]
MKNEIIINKELKILLLQVLKKGSLTIEQAKQIIEPFETEITLQQIREINRFFEAEL